MAYSDEQTFNLEKCGAEDLWVTYSRPGLLPYDESEKFIQKHKQFKEKKIAQNGMTSSMEDFLNDSNAEFEWIMGLITDWNICWPKTEDIMPMPSSEEGKSRVVWKKVPGLYMAYIVTTIKNDPTGSDFLVKGIQLSNQDKLQEEQEVERLMDTIKH